jgi:hypothetical protein
MLYRCYTKLLVQMVHQIVYQKEKFHYQLKLFDPSTAVKLSITHEQPNQPLYHNITTADTK